MWKVPVEKTLRGLRGAQQARDRTAHLLGALGAQERLDSRMARVRRFQDRLLREVDQD